MKPTLILVVAFLVSMITVQAQVIYVKPNAQGDGTSWENATGNLQKALQSATEGTQVWVAAGTYT
ncbi:MAG: right-handed parallel beta-helix repeat-containing protein, partial [Bacteroidetes bacterium]